MHPAVKGLRLSVVNDETVAFRLVTRKGTTAVNGKIEDGTIMDQTS